MKVSSEMFEALNGTRVFLRAWTESDISAAFEFYGDREVSKFLGDGQPVESLEKVGRILTKFTAHHNQFGFSPLAVVQRDTDRVIGICGLHTYNLNQEPELGFRIRRLDWGAGIATEASRLAIENGFNTLRLPRIIAFTHPENFATQRVLKKLGFAELGAQEVDGYALLKYEIKNQI